MTKDELIKARLWMYYWTPPAFDEKSKQMQSLIVKALDAQIKACDVPKIEGLGEALDVIKKYGEEGDDLKSAQLLADFYYNHGRYPEEITREAARAYHKITGGE